MEVIADDLRVTESDTFDLYVGRMWKAEPVVRDAGGAPLASAWGAYPLDTVHGGVPIDDVRLWSGAIMYLGLPWGEAVRYLRALREAGGSGLLAPSTYRVPRVSPEQGLALARAEFARVRNPDATYGDLGGPVDEYCCWRYGAPNLTAQAEGYIPGMLYIYIHKLTGRVCSAKEVEVWVRMYHVE